MNGIHDAGGMHGFGPVDRSETALARLERWEAAAIALATLAWNHANLDEFRHAVERMAPAHYLSSTYYEHWVDGALRLFEEHGEFDPSDFERRFAECLASPADVADIPGTPGPTRPGRPPRDGHRFRREGSAPRFQPGDAVLTRNINPDGHTRLARYIRGKRGTIETCHGVFVFPDTNAHALGEDPQPLYSVRFTAAEVWGADAGPNETIYVDLWESYLQAI